MAVELPSVARPCLKIMQRDLNNSYTVDPGKYLKKSLARARVPVIGRSLVPSLVCFLVLVFHRQLPLAAKGFRSLAGGKLLVQMKTSAGAPADHHPGAGE